MITYLSGYLSNSLYKYNLSNFNQIGGSIGFTLNGMPNSISANYSQTNGERKYVDNPTTFLIGDGSNLKVGKVENTAGAIGTSGNGKLSIDEYVGHNLENNDETKTKGGSLSLSFVTSVIVSKSLLTSSPEVLPISTFPTTVFFVTDSKSLFA